MTSEAALKWLRRRDAMKQTRAWRVRVSADIAAASARRRLKEQTIISEAPELRLRRGPNGRWCRWFPWQPERVLRIIR